jgi:hypothetical protein
VEFGMDLFYPPEYSPSPRGVPTEMKNDILNSCILAYCPKGKNKV